MSASLLRRLRTRLAIWRIARKYAAIKRDLVRRLAQTGAVTK